MKKCAYCGRETEEAALCCTSCGKSEFGDLAAPAAAKAPSKGKPWLGVLLSLLVPGFGIGRGGSPGVAVAWFLGLQSGWTLVVLVLALEWIPFRLGLAAGALCLAAELLMLYQSYRPGRMTGKLWAAFAGMLVLNLVLSSLAQLVARPFKMPSGSIRPTLQGASGHGDHLIVDRLTYRFSSPRRGDLLVFLTEGMSGLPQDQIYVKRIVGMPGERLELRDDSVFVNGVRLTERDGIPPIPYVTREAAEKGGGGSSASYEVAEQSYFVLGDNSTNSLDSRYWGCVPRRNVYGKVTGIYYPFSRAGRLRPVGKPAPMS
jgi:signal peptidase I